MNSERQPLVSVVTPMYNEAEHLAECIESVVGQTYRNWEYIIVDNCSTDGSAEIARQYAARDRRIRLSHNTQLLKALANHNAALRLISPASKYCKMVFADDWIFPECIERMVAVAEAHPSLGLVGAYGLEGPQVVWTGLPYPSTVVSGHEICRRLFLDGLYVFGTATSLLYRADLVRSRKIFYNEANIHADMETCIALLGTSDFGFAHQVLTFTRVREQSRITMSRNMNTLAASNLRHLAAYARQFLSQEEFDACLRRSLAEYYKYLAGSLLRGRAASFWEYHRSAFRDAGVGFSRTRLGTAVLAALFTAALNPRASLQRLLRVTRDQSATFRAEMTATEATPAREVK
ncbi:MAG: glycosyltransferase family A protein [Bryobacteraceae bacterium]|jgi:glycosyltransferase involved in cell wall biosynthesis